MTIKYVPGKGWVTEGGMNVSAGSQDIKNAEQVQGVKQGNRRSMYGNYDQYMDQDNLSWLKENVGDSWWWGAGRLGNLASDQDRFWREFQTTSDEQYGKSAEAVNRYMALINSGMDPSDIQSGVFGGSNLSPTFDNSGGGGVTGPGMLSGGGDNANNAGASDTKMSAADMLRRGLGDNYTPKTRERGQVWGPGNGMLGEETNQMRQAIINQIQKKLVK